MNLLQLVGGVAAAGVVAAGATAVTGSGVVWGAGTGASATNFVGGTLTQTVTGATVDSVVYGYADAAAQTKTNSMAIGITGAAGKFLSVTPSGGTWGTNLTTDEWYCTDTSTGTSTWAAGAANTGTAKIAIASSPMTITCKPAWSTGDVTTSRYYTGLGSVDLAITTS